METKEQLVNTIKAWVKIDNEIRALQKEQNVRSQLTSTDSQEFAATQYEGKMTVVHKQIVCRQWLSRIAWPNVNSSVKGRIKQPRF